MGERGAGGLSRNSTMQNATRSVHKCGKFVANFATNRSLIKKHVCSSHSCSRPLAAWCSEYSPRMLSARAAAALRAAGLNKGPEGACGGLLQLRRSLHAKCACMAGRAAETVTGRHTPAPSRAPSIPILLQSGVLRARPTRLPAVPPAAAAAQPGGRSWRHRPHPTAVRRSRNGPRCAAFNCCHACSWAAAAAAAATMPKANMPHEMR